jgi:hypothetical protein
LIDPDHSPYLPCQPHFTLSWLNVLAWGRKVMESDPAGMILAAR